jgi:hypothetical protein
MNQLRKNTFPPSYSFMVIYPSGDKLLLGFCICFVNKEETFDDYALGLYSSIKEVCI